MSMVTIGIVVLAAITTLLIIALIVRPSLSDAVTGKVLSFLSLFILPVGLGIAGFQHHMEVSKSTQFCLSCHVMERQGKSFYIDDPNYLVAAHFQNRRIPREQACYTCHTHYAMFGGLESKIGGLKHLWVNYLGTIPDELELYQPYHNRECLHCHSGARSFEETTPHDIMMDELVANDTSCLDCHSDVHGTDELDKATWKQGGEG